MRITAIKTHPISIPYAVPRVTAHEPMRAAAVILVEVQTDEGVTGVGQIHGAPQKDICEWVAKLAEVARGMDALAHADVHDRLFSLMAPRPHGYLGRDGLPKPLPRPARPLITAALGGIDIALWDLKGKAAKLPVYSLLGGTARPVFTYSTGGYYREDGAPDGCAEELASFVAMGFKGVKLKVGGATVVEDVDRVRRSREAIGRDTMFLLDCTAAYDLETAIAFARAVEPYGIHWLEEPLYWYLQPADFRRLTESQPIPLAHCERELHRFTVRDFITTGAIKFVQFDSTRHGGFTESVRIAGIAEQYGVRIAPHHAPELHAHLCAAYPEASFGVESHAAHDPLAPLYLDRPATRDGYVRLTDAHGFGVEYDWTFAQKHRP